MTNTGAGLDLATVTALLAEEKTAQRQSSTSDKTVDKFLKPVQVGPLRYMETAKRCTSRGCGTQTNLTVKGVPLCVNHSLYELNRLLLKANEFDFSDCDCKAGMHSKMNVHTEGCPVWVRVKELTQVDSNSSATT